MSNIKDQKGVSLLFTILIMSVILSVSLGVSGVLVRQIKTIEDVGYSVVSFYAADSGVEQQLYDLYKTLPEESHQSQYTDDLNIIDSSASYIVTASCSSDTLDCYNGFMVDESCGAVNYCITSIGTFEGTKRAIKIEY